MGQARRLCAVAAAAIALTGCGGGGSAVQTQVTRTVTRAFVALAEGDGAAFCALTTATGRTRLAQAAPGAGATCAATVERVSGELAPETQLALRHVRVARMTVHGSTATIAARDISATQGSLAGFFDVDSPPTILTRGSGGRWRISG